MPIEYDIQPALGTVFLTYHGRVTDPELFVTYINLYTDPAYQPGYNELADCRRVTLFDVSTKAIRGTGEMAVLAAGAPPVPAKVAIVAGDDVVYGLGRLYQIVQEPTSELVEVFRDIVEARKWLGLEELSQ